MTKKNENILVPQCLSNLVPLKSGFTLAEVLITLGIIGIVAAMTIPTLIANYQEKSWNTSAQVFERKLEEALKVMNTQQTLTGYSSTESFVGELKKHIKIIKTCDNTNLSDCFSDVIYWGGGSTEPEEIDLSVLKTAKNFGQKDWGTNIVGVQFANGTNALIAYNTVSHSDDPATPLCIQNPYSSTVNVGDCLAILYDTSGHKSPNSTGKDIRNNKNVTKLGSSCLIDAGNVCISVSPQKPTAVSKAECEQLKASGYGIKNCYSDNDYWAGAVKQCGGVNKLPTTAQLAEFANYLYNTTGVSATGDKTGLSRDPAKFAALGFLNSSVDVWSRDEKSSNKVSERYFSSASTYFDSMERSDSSVYVLCVSGD